MQNRFFREALSSVFSQMIPLWNLILIDDHTTDPATLKILRELKDSEDDRISVIENKSELIIGALNTGMRYCKTPYVCTLHCNDLLAVKVIEILNRYIQNYPSVDYFHSSRIVIDDSGSPISSTQKAKKKFILSNFNNFGPVKALHCWKVSSSLAIGGMDGSLGLHGADDYDFSWSMMEAGYYFKAILECLYYIRDHRKHYRLTTHVPLKTQINKLKKILRKNGLTLKEIGKQIHIRTSGYLKQALFVDDRDKRRKERQKDFDMKKG
jgi:glycosyltransferase involved in cell wall biosynthesis